MSILYHDTNVSVLKSVFSALKSKFTTLNTDFSILKLVFSVRVTVRVPDGLSYIVTK